MRFRRNTGALPANALPLETFHMNSSFDVLGVILARGGSLGLTGKHLRLLLGRPVIDYTIDHAAEARSLTRVVVTSDCPQVRKCASARLLTTIARPASLATDTASVQSVLLHAMDEVEQRTAWRAGAVVILYGNVPLRPVGAIDACVGKLIATGCDSVRTFCGVGKWHPGWMSRLDGDVVHACRPGSIDRRQDLEALYLHDGGCVAMSRASLERGRATPADPHAMFGEDRRGIIVGEGETVEVDCERDLFIAEAVLRQRGVAETRIRYAG